MGDTSLVHIPEAQANTITNFLYTPQESIKYAAEANKRNRRGKFSNRILVATNCRAVVFHAKIFGRITMSKSFPISELTKISMENAKTLTLAFGEKTLIVESSEATTVINVLQRQFNSIYYGNPHIPTLTITSEPADIAIPPVIARRSLDAFCSRYLSICIQHNLTPSPDFLSIAENIDNNKTPILKIGPEMAIDGDFDPIIAAISTEPLITQLSFNNYPIEKLPNFIESVAANSPFISAIDFDGYSSGIQKTFSTYSPSTLKIIAFTKCSTDFIISILPTLECFSCSIKSITFNNLECNSQEMTDIINHLNSNKIFAEVETLGFYSLIINGFPAEPIIKLINSRKSLNKFIIQKFRGDASPILDIFLKNQIDIQSLHITEANFESDIKATMLISQSMQVFDISHSTLSVKNLTKIIKTLCSFARNENSIIVDFSYLTLDGSGNRRPFSQLDKAGIEPSIFEFDYSGNEVVDSNEFSAIVSFLRTQKKLSRVEFGECFVSQFDSILKMLSDLIHDFQISGFDISSQPEHPMKEAAITFLKSILDISSLHSLSINNAQFGLKGLNTLVQVVEANPRIEEMCVEGERADNKDEYIDWLQTILSAQSIQVFQLPDTDLKELQIDVSRIEYINLRLLEMRGMPSLQERLSFYLRECKKKALEAKAEEKPEDISSLFDSMVKNMKEAKEEAYCSAKEMIKSIKF